MGKEGAQYASAPGPGHAGQARCYDDGIGAQHRLGLKQLGEQHGFPI